MLDAGDMEAPLVRELLEMKEEITRQMNITERLTDQFKGNRKSYLEVENANIIKKKKAKELKQYGQNMETKSSDKQNSDISLLSDGDVNEVTVTSDEMVKEDSEENPDDSETRKLKNNSTTKTKSLLHKKIEDGEYFGLIINVQNLTLSVE